METLEILVYVMNTLSEGGYRRNPALEIMKEHALSYQIAFSIISLPYGALAFISAFFEEFNHLPKKMIRDGLLVNGINVHLASFLAGIDHIDESDLNDVYISMGKVGFLLAGDQLVPSLGKHKHFVSFIDCFGGVINSEFAELEQGGHLREVPKNTIRVRVYCLDQIYFADGMLVIPIFMHKLVKQGKKLVLSNKYVLRSPILYTVHFNNKLNLPLGVISCKPANQLC